MKITQQAVIGFLLGLLLGGAVVYLVMPAKSTTTKSSTTGTSTKSSSTSSNVSSAVVGSEKGTYSISVFDQGAGSSVSVTYAVMSATWIAVQDDIKGSLGNVLGAKLVERGSGTAVIPLLRNTTPGGTYHVAIYADDGDRAFEYRVDPEVVDQNKKAIIGTFSATGGSASRQ